MCGMHANGITIVYVGVQSEALVFRLFYEHDNVVCNDTARNELGSERWTAVYSSDIEPLALTDMASDPTITYTNI